jgi:hypothetical protein
MLSLTDTLPDNSVYVLGRARPVLGTAMLGRTFGVITRASLVRSGKREEIVNDAGELMVLLLTNPGWTLQLECLFDADVEAPGFLEPISLPYVGITGRVMEGVAVAWEGDGKERTLSIPAAQWDAMESDSLAYRITPDGAGQPISMTMDYDGSLYTMDATWPGVGYPTLTMDYDGATYFMDASWPTVDTD